MDRRSFLQLSAGFAAFPFAARAAFQPAPSGWRTFQTVTRLELPAAQTKAQAWVPVASVNEAAWMTSGEASWTGNADEVSLKTDPVSGAQFVHAVWAAHDAPVLEVTTSVRTQDRAVDLSQPGETPALSDADRALYTSATELLPTDGIVLETAQQIVTGAKTDLQKARRIYEWIVENTARNPETRGCGLGDIASMLHTGDLTGKCADLNALYVGLARAAGLPARDIYGLRVAPSAFGYKSLGAGSANVTKAQHCRAEVFLEGFGWVAVDPADVRKVMLQEPPTDLSLDDPKVVDVRKGLFGGWEGNWLGYNFAHDVVLPGSEGDAVEYLMYPQAEIDGARQDSLEPDDFVYTITASELPA
ncbi:transglutaminase-like domain-containing protein [Tropicibacter naphthalenivorans]|uniref:Transglutaminase-like domain-containing protein n=1 Tax=Tropicibacter naphthalenivorans TaxID=441103 RepID=A0A0N7M0L4_9RHOB|nr:transglutaminase domain-containing protein [Tropicibacter naphthalenivorans]CUH80793.1 putative protein involved in cytokinesis, contains TGc (transglutaminase/protease-like) domain [Tropicibacter naphthalenivorans]SMC90250.1 Transglutaminase-like enzyme, putative cysteine protease [Tropicibacter naphthalenivorans]